MRTPIIVGIVVALVLGTVAFYIHRWQRWEHERDLLQSSVEGHEEELESTLLLIEDFDSMFKVGPSDSLIEEKDRIEGELQKAVDQLDQHLDKGWFP